MRSSVLNAFILSAIIFLTVSLVFCDTDPSMEPDRSDTLVILIHGIIDKPTIMWKIEKHLKDMRYQTLNFDYASTKSEMDSVIAKLNREIVAANNPEIHKIHFVTHSLGSLVIRAYLSQYSTGKEGRLVMIAPPNQGSVAAERIENWPLFKILLGPAGQKLGKDTEDYCNIYPAPKIPFEIIAGGLGNDRDFTRFIPGDDDGTVGVEETKLPGYLAIVTSLSFQVCIPLYCFRMKSSNKLLHFFGPVSSGADQKADIAFPIEKNKCIHPQNYFAKLVVNFNMRFNNEHSD